MKLTYNISRNSSDETIKSIVDQLNAIEGITVDTKYIALFKTELYIKSDLEMSSDEILALGALIGTIEANQYI